MTSGIILSCFSIDVSADLNPGVGYGVVPIDAHMARIGAIAVIKCGTDGDGAAVSRKEDATSGIIPHGFSIDVSADLLPAGDHRASAVARWQDACGCAVNLLLGHGDWLLEREKPGLWVKVLKCYGYYDCSLRFLRQG